MKKILPLAVAAVWLVLACASVTAQITADPQAVGSIEGRVFNQATGNYLSGVSVELGETGRVELTDRLGHFRFTNVPVGPATLQVSYPGLEAVKSTAVVSPTTLTQVPDIGLRSRDDDVIKLDSFVVSAEREGQAKALVMQRDAPNIVTSVAVDAYGNVGSSSVGNLLQYMPGLTVEGFDGEAHTASVRGMSADYGSITMDGAKVASMAEGTLNRTTYVFSVGLVNFSEIEVIKAPTPDYAADSTGGVINMRTRSVFSSKTTRSGRISAGGSATLKRGMRFKETQPNYTFNYRQIIGESQRWGFTVNASQSRRYLPRDQSIINYEATYDTVNPSYPYINSVTRQFGYQDVKRGSFGGRLEFKPSADSLISFAVTYDTLERFGNNSARTWASTSNTIGVPVLPQGYEGGTTYTGSVGIAAGYTDNEVFWPKAQVRYESQISRQKGETLGLRMAGEHKLNDWKLDYNANYSRNELLQRSSGDWPGGFGGQMGLTVRNVGLKLTGMKDSAYYRLQHVGGQNPEDITAYNVFNYGDWNQNQSLSTVASTGFNLSRKMVVLNAPTVLKVGMHYQDQGQDQVPTRWNEYSYIGPRSGVTRLRMGGDSPKALDDPINPLQFEMPLYFGEIVNASAIRADVQNRPQDWSGPRPNASGQIDRGYEEHVTAAYAMATSRIRSVTVLGGVRVERTDVSAQNNLLPDPILNSPKTAQEDSYTNVFPSFHATWRHRSGVQMRGSFSTSIGRPSPNSIIPSTTVTPYGAGDDDADSGRGRINRVNTGLKPRFSNNYDFAVEYYPKVAGRFSAGVFRKDLKSFIFSTSSVIGSGPDNGFSGEYEGWDLVTQANGGKGRVTGFEFDYQTPNLGQFASILEGFTMFANYTRLTAKGDYGDGGSKDLTGFKPETGNVGIGYNRSGTSIRARMNFRGQYLRFANASPVLERWEADQTKFDLNFEQKILGNVSFYVDLINITNTKGVRYRGNPDQGFRPHWVDNNGAELYSGFNVVF